MPVETADISQELRNTENALRDFIAGVLETKLGPEWVDHCGVSADQIAAWHARYGEYRIKVRIEDAGLE